MRLFGRPVCNPFRYEPAEAPELQELELVADSETSQRLASLLIDIAAQMEDEGTRFEHVHLLDVWHAHGTGTRDIVFSQPLGMRD